MYLKCKALGSAKLATDEYLTLIKILQFLIYLLNSTASGQLQSQHEYNKNNISLYNNSVNFLFIYVQP
jgi:hypothetical protein